MREYDPKLDRLATVLLIRGFALLAFAAIAVRWPEQTLVEAVRYAGGIAVFLGIVELGIALAGPALLSIRSFRVGHAIMSIAFGIVSGIVVGQPLARGLVVAAGWLGAYTVLLLLLAARFSFAGRIRNALLWWSAFNVVAIVACTVLAGQDRVIVLLTGALYTAALGAVTITAARWMRRGWMAVERTESRGTASPARLPRH